MVVVDLELIGGIIRTEQGRTFQIEDGMCSGHKRKGRTFEDSFLLSMPGAVWSGGDRK